MWAGNQDAPLIWFMGTLAYPAAVSDALNLDPRSRIRRALVPIGFAIAVLGWINVIDLLMCPPGCRAWALSTGVAFGVYAVVFGGALLTISQLHQSKGSKIASYALAGLYIVAIPLSLFFLLLGL